jgi:uncharacterized NAD(P)/FAD-binding protein YdhS
MTPSLTLAIIGGGFAGTCLACHAQAALPASARILLFEGSGQAGPGLAYGTTDPAHLLNVPAGGMSLWADRPAHFSEWLARQPDAPAAPADGGPVFAPRRLYGRYLVQELAAAQDAPGAALRVVPQAVAEVSRQGEGFLLRDAGGAEHAADAVVLAIGGFAAGRGTPPCLFGDPWDPAALEGLDPQAPVLLVGMGLTMVDVLLSLRRRGHQGPVLAVSRHGWLPLPHLEGPFPPAWPMTLPEPLPGPAALSRQLRREAARAAAAGTPWQAVVDGFRPLVQRVWRGWNGAQRRSFLRHGRTAWNLHRHRLPPEATYVLRAAVGEGSLRVLAGRLQDWQPQGQGCLARLRLRDGALKEVPVDRILLCTGPDGSADWRQAAPVPALLAQGLAVADELGMAPAIDSESRNLLGLGGAPVPSLYMIGPLTRGALWEATAAPEIRAQAAALVAYLSRDGVKRAKPV